MFEHAIPWTAAVAAGGVALHFARLWWIERRKLSLDERTSSTDMVTKHAERVQARNDQLEPFRDQATAARHDHCDCCRVMARMIVAGSSEGYGDAEREAVRHLRAHGFGHLIEGVVLASDIKDGQKGRSI